MRLRCDQDIAGWVARHRQAVRLDDATNAPRYYAAMYAVKRRGKNAVALVDGGVRSGH